MSRRSWSSTKPSLKANWKLPGILPAPGILYFEPKYEEFRLRIMWSLSNAFTSALKELDPIPQFKATAKLSEFLERRDSRSHSNPIGGTGRAAAQVIIVCLTLVAVIYPLGVPWRPLRIGPGIRDCPGS